MELQGNKKKKLKRRKVNVRVTMSPYLVKNMETLVDRDEEFSSVSDFISIAVTEFLVKYPIKEEVKV